jgi:hypothetical protein
VTGAVACWPRQVFKDANCDLGQAWSGYTSNRVPMTDEPGAIAFAEKVLELLDQGVFTATYKYALLLALIDLCHERFSRGGHAPESVTTRQIAEKILELYWPHAMPFGDQNPCVLRQNKSGQAEILTLIVRFRETQAKDPSAPIARARLAAPDAYDRLVGDVEWKLIEMPLPRLQRFGADEDRFIYEISWDDRVKRREARATDFQNVVRFKNGVGDHLVRLAGLLRPLLQRRWAADVAKMNKDLVEDAGLEVFLFGTGRISLAKVMPHLRDLQDDRCFYCGDRVRGPEVDHFIPWARVPLDAIENLVVADAKCNGHKRDHLAASNHVEAWAARLRDRRGDLDAIARQIRWENGGDRVLGVARATYLRLPAFAKLWHLGDDFVAAEPVRLVAALG